MTSQTLHAYNIAKAILFLRSQEEDSPMNIDEIIRKCVEVPGISIERGEYSAGLFLNEKDGKGFVTFFRYSRD